MPIQILVDKDKMQSILSTEISGFEVKEYGTKFRVMGRLTRDYKKTLSLGDFDTLPEAQEFMIGLGRQIEAG